MAGFAFEAYSTPEMEDGDRESDGRQLFTSFLSPTFLAQVYDGLLTVRVEGASGLPAMDLWGSSDPYIVARVGRAAARSSTRWRTLTPEWDPREEPPLKIYVEDPAAQSLELACMDQDLLQEDDKLGIAQVELAALCDGRTHCLNLGLTGEGGGGELRLQVQYQPFNLEQLRDLGGAGSGLDQLRGQAMEAGAELDRIRKQASMAGEVLVGGDVTGAALASFTAAAAVASQEIPALGDLSKGNLFCAAQEAVKGAARRSAEGDDETREWTERVRARARAAAYKAGMAQLASGLPLTSLQGAGAWSVLARAIKPAEGLHDNYEYCCFVEDEATNTQVSLWRNVEAGAAVVAFRGTEQTEWQDLVTDISLSFASHRDAAEQPSGAAGERALVHSGFMAAYDSVRARLLELLECLVVSMDALRALRGLPPVPQVRVYITGHSLGGALATLFAFDAAELQQNPEVDVTYDIIMYNFGSPRVGNAAFVESYNRMVPNSFRIFNTNDVVPTVPRLLGYRHVNRGLLLDSVAGALNFLDAENKSISCDDQIGEIQVSKEALQAVQWTELTKAEFAMLERLTSGVAITEHLEDFYFNALQKCVRNDLPC